MADNTYLLEVITPEQILFRDEVQFTVVPALDGELGVLRNHAPLAVALTIGVLRYKDASANEHLMAMSGGLMEVIDNTARVLAETAEMGEDIDVLRAKSSKERAEKRLAQQDEELNYVRAQMSLQRAIARIKAANAE